MLQQTLYFFCCRIYFIAGVQSSRVKYMLEEAYILFICIIYFTFTCVESFTWAAGNKLNSHIRLLAWIKLLRTLLNSRVYS